MQQFGLKVDIYDPYANPVDVKKQYGLEIIKSMVTITNNYLLYDAIILAVAHDEFKTLDLAGISNVKTVIFDTKAILDRSKVDGRL